MDNQGAERVSGLVTALYYVYGVALAATCPGESIRGDVRWRRMLKDDGADGGADDFIRDGVRVAVAGSEEVMREYYVYAPGRIFVSANNDKGKRYNVLTMYQWGEHGENRKAEIEDTANRIVLLLNAFDGVSTETLEQELFSVAARLKKEAVG